MTAAPRCSLARYARSVTARVSPAPPAAPATPRSSARCAVRWWTRAARWLRPSAVRSPCTTTWSRGSPRRSPSRDFPPADTVSAWRRPAGGPPAGTRAGNASRARFARGASAVSARRAAAVLVAVACGNLEAQTAPAPIIVELSLGRYDSRTVQAFRSGDDALIPLRQFADLAEIATLPLPDRRAGAGSSRTTIAFSSIRPAPRSAPAARRSR